MRRTVSGGGLRLIRDRELRWKARNVDRRWDVAIVAFAAQLLMSFTDRCSGFLCVGYMDLFLVDRREANWPQSVAFVVNFTAGVCSCPYFSGDFLCRR